MWREYASTQIVLGVAVMALSLVFLARSDRATFQWMFLVGLMGSTGGIVASNLISFWIAIIPFGLWFCIAAYFIVSDKKERTRGARRD